MNKKIVLASVALLLAACGDDVTQINQTGLEVVGTADDLPECTSKNKGEQVLVTDEAVIRVCVDGEWFATKSGAADDLSCTTEELKDGSGLKIICNGDSIGVVLNGEKGKDGKDAVLSNDTLEADSERVAISLDSLVGVTQKGPFLKGSTVYLYELSDGRTLKQTNGNFTSNITSNDGRYKFTARDLVSQYAMVVVDGYYRNEVTGNVSDAPIRLKAITDMRKRSSVNVNILTHLEFDRVYSLVTRGNSKGEKLTVKQAKKQAQKEILKVFGIELDKDTDAEDMDVFGKTDADAALLALSVLLQGDRTESDMMALLSEISNALAENGEWNDSAAKAQIALWAAVADGKGRLDSAYNHVKGWGLGDNVPPFEKYIRSFYGEETGLGLCGSKANSSGAKKTLKTNSDTLNFSCEDAEKGWWRLLTQLDVDTVGWGTDFEEGDVRNGQVDASLTYVFENGAWRHGTSLDSTLGLGCILARKDSLVRGSAVDYYRCVADTMVSFEGLNWTSVWRKATNDELDMDFWKRNWNDNGLLLRSPYTGKTMVWDADSLREPNLVEQDWNKACVSYMYANKEDGIAIDTLSNGLQYTCSDTGWSKLGLFLDEEDVDGNVYKAVQIGAQTWMAENMRYQYTVWDKNIKDRVPYGSFCYGDVDSNCSKYGRLYSWAIAMDSVGRRSSDGKGCGYGKTCSVSSHVRGICPKGWHLPARSDFEKLFKTVGGESIASKMLKSQTGWISSQNVMDAYAFSALPAGFWDANRGYSGEGLDAVFWSSAELDDTQAYQVDLNYGSDDTYLARDDKTVRVSVRCVKDDDL